MGDTLDELFARALQAWQPPAQLSLSQWAEANFVLSAETSAEPGPWRTLPYQREILDAITDPRVTQVTWMKSARVGYTLCLSAAIGYYIHHEPSSIFVVQPTVDDAKGFSKETIAPMLRDVPVLAQVVFADLEETGKGPKDSSQTLTHKAFPGGILSLAGANSGTGFRRISRRIVMFDEVDAYPLSAGVEGDPIKLGMKRSEYFWNRKIIAGSTPLVSGTSRIEEMYQAGDRRRYYVPCPECRRMDYLRFNVRRDDEDHETGHVMRWTNRDPKTACFECRGCGCAIEESSKRWMLEHGEWRAEGEFNGHASFHLWAAYSVSPNATWAQIVEEFLATEKNPRKLQTFVNTTLAETFSERGDAPDWEILQDRAEDYAPGTVPPRSGVIVLTCGVDVQKDRLMYEVVGWQPNKENFSVEAGALYGDTSSLTSPDSAWRKLDGLLGRSFPVEGGGEMPIAMMGVDSGYNTQTVYNWCRQHPMSRVIACKGQSGAQGARMLVSPPSPVDVKVNGKPLRRGYKVWPIGVDIAKSEFYGWLALKRKPTEALPDGYCHFPAHGPEYFQQITAEVLVTTTGPTGRKRMEWQVQPNRENHYLDCRILARVAVAVLGLDQLPADQQQREEEGVPSSPAQAPSSPPPPPSPARPQASSFFGPKTGDWFGRRR